MASNRRLLQLSSLIQENTARVDTYIEKHGFPEPSFEASYPPVLDLPPEVNAARQAALEALDELRDHLLGPIGVLTDTVTNFADRVSLQGLVHFKLAESLPGDGSTITVTELAKTSGMHPDDAETIVRHGVTRRLLNQRGSNGFAHSAASKAIINVPNLAAFIEGILENMWRAAPFVVEAMAKWPGSQELDQTPFNLGRRTDLPFFEYLAKDEAEAKAFANSMTFMQSGPALKVNFVFEYDWSQHANGTVVDIGGSEGIVAFELAEKFPDMKIIVQDRPEVVALAPRNAHANVRFQEHDFFAPQPVKDADVYFFRWILHDWPKNYCINILQALVPALKPGARVVLMDAVLPEPGVLSPFQERAIRNYDMGMKTLFNAKERSETDWRHLIGEAYEDGKYKIVEVLRPVGSQLGFLVIEWTG